MGPVTPLLAVWDVLRTRYPQAQGVWVGTPHGPERALVESSGLPFFALAAPKLSRHQPWTIPWNIMLGLWSLLRAANILRQQRPNVLLSVGAYVSVPLAVVAYFMRIPVCIHQLDVVPLLANRLMAPCAKTISTTWPQSVSSFSQKKTMCTGGFARSVLTRATKETGRRRFALNENIPCILVTGGGTGAASLNTTVTAIVPELTAIAYVIHLTGKGKMTTDALTMSKQFSRYIPIEFLGEGMADALAAADLVITRAGMGILCDLVTCGKPAILIPLPSVHQIANANAAAKGGAAVMLNPATPQTLLQHVQRILGNEDTRRKMAEGMCTLFPQDAAEQMAKTALYSARKSR